VQEAYIFFIWKISGWNEREIAVSHIRYEFDMKNVGFIFILNAFFNIGLIKVF
jgi:hypothetical protein